MVWLTSCHIINKTIICDIKESKICYQRKNPKETTSMERISRDFRYLFSFGQKLSWMAEMMRSIWKNWVAKPTMRKRLKKVMRNTLERKVVRDQNIPQEDLRCKNN